MTANNKSILAIAVILLQFSTALSAQGMMNKREMMMRHRMMDHSMQRHHSSMRPGGIPAPYGIMINPLPPSQENIARGAELYQTFCSVCHGKEGKGDGPAGAALKPRPANLTRFIRMPPLSRDSYLIWTLSEGGAQFQTAMPPFKASISENDRWRIIHFLHTL